MGTTVSGHPARRPGSPYLSTGTVPDTSIRITTDSSCLPLFLALLRRLDKHVKELGRDTWSFCYRPIRTGSALSDHCGWAVDVYASGVGANTMTAPSRMPAEIAHGMSRVLNDFVTPDGRYVFGWGQRRSEPGVSFRGPMYARLADPMHVFVAPGIGRDDLRATRKAMRIGKDGRHYGANG